MHCSLKDSDIKMISARAMDTLVFIPYCTEKCREMRIESAIILVSMMRIKGYSNFSISKSGVRSQTYPDSYWGAYFKLDAHVSDLFPFINATIDEAKLFDRPKHIQFIFQDAHCTLYQHEVIAAAFKDEAHARDFANQLVAYLNDLDEKKASIMPEYRPHRIVSPVNIYKLLPQTNCQECGFATCVAFAASVGRSMAAPEQCPGFAKPLYHHSVYPVFDDDGNLTSTFTIETGVSMVKTFWLLCSR